MHSHVPLSFRAGSVSDGSVIEHKLIHRRLRFRLGHSELPTSQRTSCRLAGHSHPAGKRSAKNLEKFRRFLKSRRASRGSYWVDLAEKA